MLTAEMVRAASSLSGFKTHTGQTGCGSTDKVNRWYVYDAYNMRKSNICSI